ncbi:helix-turn-helix domain-containing protein [Streptomyces sp. ISL-100]|uniref:helix-turn-helix domain-containing protein n=1 Tax=Streptomyces sp. ISL-100 TaxID=2819173 RepID=UPI001BE81C1C|nr:helix-turn-helix domain-containing protein [Streptomyces sp. ISL-100]MBT2397617.1 helix-turn-helix domain-containing protein [Streptomyces sp. ISL-100]
MDVQHLSARSRASSGDRRAATRSGVVHANTRHTSRYTVVGNHLSQHRELTLVAIGLAVHIQSLPAGARIGIKFLAARFPESEARIASALRELEACGYLKRSRERLPNGRIVTRTVSCNQPGARPAAAAPSRPRRPKAARPAPVGVPVEQQPAPPPEPAPAPASAAAAPRRVTPPLPEPLTEDPVRDRVAVDLLARLRQDDPRLTLAERDVHRLAPGVAAWLERSAAPEAVRQALTTGLPEQPTSPAGLIAHRLTELMPGPLPPEPVVVRPDPFQDCEGCDRPFRAPEPGRCRDCRPVVPGAA